MPCKSPFYPLQGNRSDLTCPRELRAFFVPHIQFSDLAIKNLKPTGSQFDMWDAKLPTFGVRVSQAGAKTFILRKNNRRIKLGRYPHLSLQDARKAAHKLISEEHEPEIGSESTDAGGGPRNLSRDPLRLFTARNRERDYAHARQAPRL